MRANLLNSHGMRADSESLRTWLPACWRTLATCPFMARRDNLHRRIPSAANGGIAEVDGQPSIAEGDARDPQWSFSLFDHAETPTASGPVLVVDYARRKQWQRTVANAAAFIIGVDCEASWPVAMSPW